MAMEILKSFGTLQSELEQAKTSLKGVDESIKRLIGRDPAEIIPQRNLAIKRTVTNDDSKNRQRGSSRRVFEVDEPPVKRRGSVFKRLSDRPSQYEEEPDAKSNKQMISKVIVTPKEVPSRQDALAAQNSDEKSKARNRRMFGALLDTLQKFQQEETKLKSKEDKRAQLEKKIEEHEIREKAEIKKERQELFFNRKKKQAEIRMIELKMTRMKEYSTWEERQKPRINFILTKAKPQIYYLPRKLNDVNKAALEECKIEVLKMIDKKRQDVFDDLQQIEDKMKKNFERKPNDEKQEDATNDDSEDKNDNLYDDVCVNDNVNVEEDNKMEELKEQTNGNEETINTTEKEVVEPKQSDAVESIELPIEQSNNTQEAQERMEVQTEN